MLYSHPTTEKTKKNLKLDIYYILMYYVNMIMINETIRKKHLTREQRRAIIEGFEIELRSMIDLAKEYRVCRQNIYRILKNSGVDTTKRRYPVICYVCDAKLSRTKGRIKQLSRHFCSLGCYHAFLQAGGTGVDNRYGRKIARHKVGKVFDLQPKYVVHHLDRDNNNNLLSNLVVFKDQGDHVRYHRDFEIKPIWEGSNS